MVRLRELRVLKLYSIRGLAKAAEVSDRTVWVAETGQSRPSLTTIRKLSRALEVDPLDVDEFKEAMDRASGTS